MENIEGKTTEAQGACLCGAVRFTTLNASNSMEACHCGMCRRWGGGPLLSIPCGREVTYEGEENIAVYASSAWAERGFCKVCGSHLFFRVNANQHHYIPVGLFDQQGSFTFERQSFIDRKPSFYAFENKTRNVTEAQFMGNEGQP